METTIAAGHLAAQQDGVITAAQCRQLGLSPIRVTQLCRNGTWQRLAHGAYLVAPSRASRRAFIRAVLAGYGPGAAVMLGTAAELHGLEAAREGPVHVAIPAARATRSRRPGVASYQRTLGVDDVTEVDGIAATSVLRTLADLVLSRERLSAVALVDGALHEGALRHPGDLVPYITGRRGALAARKYLAEADGNAESPLETRVRLRCADGGVPPEALQYPVRTAGGLILGYGDLAWPRDRLIAEADGDEAYREPGSLARDRRRQNDMTNAGWRVLRFTWQDTLRPGYVPAVVRAALGPAGSGRGRVRAG
ncbi:type IV toxin-antitoxin system AbiEi family antitoxin domain-containing protein [Longispora albida]|uniref:type IV toxin-antitoxin system AbiEi family antitoxin domain-containing protein n=1 Tax=Longispora albida TaxID=203523 RepID=UPI00035EE046|nr:type IV toxin-antitoxin system AbiEi family antitoxin domain-containing protein [Longispora albida]